MAGRKALRDLAVVVLSAVATAALLVVPLLPGAVSAGNEPDAPTATIERPVLRSHGCELTMEAAATKHAAGDRFLATLRVANGSASETARVPVVVSLMETPPSHPAARMVSMPREIWRLEELVAVAPGETATVALAPDASLKPGRFTAYLVQVGDEGMQMLDAFVPIPAPAGGPLASSRPSVD